MDINPMDNSPPPPDPNDHHGWHSSVMKNNHLKYDAQVLFCALQGLGAKANMQVRNALANQLSRLVIKFLRRKVSNNFPNEGLDIIFRAQDYVFNAAAKPNSSDGIGFREAFYPRLSFRLKDAIKKEYNLRRTEENILAEKLDKKTRNASTRKVSSKGLVSETNMVEGQEDLGELDSEQAVSSHEPDDNHYDDSPSTKTTYDHSLFDEVNECIEHMDVDRLLKMHVPDERKRLVFRLFMDDVPYKSKRRATTHSIADAMGIDESTARAWVQEIKELLKDQVRRL